MVSQELSFFPFLKEAAEKGASDLHITAGAPPLLRLVGKLVPMEYPPLRPEEASALCLSVLTDEQKRTLEEKGDVLISFGVRQVGRFRANIFMQRNTVSGAFRPILYQIPPLESLGLPPIIQKWCDFRSGLIIVSGGSGTGRTTTMAAMLDQINRTRNAHILTIEAPIEFTHQHKCSVINQRDIGPNARSFSRAVRSALTQNADVVMISEVRDAETAEAAITLANMGHLTFIGFEAASIIQACFQIVSFFPRYLQDYARFELSYCLKGVLCLDLIPTLDGLKRVICPECLTCTTAAVRHLIQENRFHQLHNYMLVSAARSGMYTKNHSLLYLLHKKLISLDEAVLHSPDPDELRMMMAPPKKGVGIKKTETDETRDLGFQP